MSKFKNLTRSNTKYFVSIQIALTIIVLSYLYWGKYSPTWLLTGIFVYFLTGCLGVTVTFHRLLSHKSYTTHKMFKNIFSLFGALGGTGSPIGWVAVHRQHHACSDKANDPHSPKNLGLKVFFPSYEFEMNKWPIRDLITDRFQQIIHDYYFAILAAWAALITLILGEKGFVFIFSMPIVLQIWTSVISNYFNHKPNWGYRNFSTADQSNNLWWLALLAWGEGWHNNHHQYPGKSSFQHKWWEFDISGIVIKIIRTN